MNEERPIISAAKCRPMILVSRNIRQAIGLLCGYSQGFLWEGASNDSGVVEDGTFSSFPLAICSEIN